MIHDLIQKGCDIDCVRVFIHYTNNINETNLYGIPATIVAVKNNRPDILKLLLEHGVDVHATDNSIYKDTALSWSVFLQHSECTNILIEHGANINYITKHRQQNILIWCLKRRNMCDFKTVLEHGGSLFHIDGFGKSAFSMIKELNVHERYMCRRILEQYRNTIFNIIQHLQLPYDIITYIFSFFIVTT